MTRSRGRMTAPATSAATSAGEARPEASGAIWERLGGMLAPFWITSIYVLCRKENDFGAIFVRYSAGHGQFQTDQRAPPAERLLVRNYRSTGGPGSGRGSPDAAGQAEPLPTTNPPAQVTKMAFAWPKDQTPSNYYYYYYYYYYYC